MGARTYIQKMLVNYELTFGSPPKDYFCPLYPTDHPELDGSPFLDPEGDTKYQSLICALQWAITL